METIEIDWSKKVVNKIVVLFEPRGCIKAKEPITITAAKCDCVIDAVVVALRMACHYDYFFPQITAAEASTYFVPIRWDVMKEELTLSLKFDPKEIEKISRSQK